MEDKVKDGGAAFPSSFRYDLEDWADPGMSLRDWFAGQALSAIGTWWPGPADLSSADIQKTRAKYCYQQADAMLAAREPGQ
jgi:hypothetical protein